jgi:CubicO group peptidase (beta-lactamase class C family)
MPEAPFAAVRGVIDRALASGAFPAVSAEVGTSDGVTWRHAAGTLAPATDEDGAPADAETIFDLASLTKVLATTPVVMRLVQAGALGLEDSIGRWVTRVPRVPYVPSFPRRLPAAHPTLLHHWRSH